MLRTRHRSLKVASAFRPQFRCGLIRLRKVSCRNVSRWLFPHLYPSSEFSYTCPSVIPCLDDPGESTCVVSWTKTHLCDKHGRRSRGDKSPQNLERDPAGGAHDAPPDPLSAGEATPLPISHPTRHGPTFGAPHASPQKSSHIYAYGDKSFTVAGSWMRNTLTASLRLMYKVTIICARL